MSPLPRFIAAACGFEIFLLAATIRAALMPLFAGAI